MTSVFDLMCAHYGLDRGLSGTCATGYDDDTPYTPAWQETITGVPVGHAIRVAREFARDAEKTRDRSMFIIGAGVNH